MLKKSFVLLIVTVLCCAVVPARSQSDLPEGDGKKAVQMYCVQCHDLSQVTRAGYSREGWQNNINEYALPHTETLPRRIAITRDDVLWYSDYARGYLGRFDPATGKASEWPSPGGPKSQPYGMYAVHDVLWYSEAGVQPNTLVRFDPKTEQFQTWTIPSGGGVVRNMDVTPNGNLALACSGVNRIALVEVK